MDSFRNVLKREPAVFVRRRRTLLARHALPGHAPPGRLQEDRSERPCGLMQPARKMNRPDDAPGAGRLQLADIQVAVFNLDQPVHRCNVLALNAELVAVGSNVLEAICSVGADLRLQRREPAPVSS